MKTIKNIVLASALSLVFVGCAGDRYHRSTGTYIDDSTLHAKVKTDLLTEPGVSGHAVKVEVYQGRVQLAGFVDTQQQKECAGNVARRVNGVQWVKNDLVVKNQVPQSPCVPTVSTSSTSIYEPAGANQQGSSGSGVGAGAHVGPVGAGVNVGGGEGVGAGAHVGPVGAGAHVGGTPRNSP
ncbi:MAG: BON domain-containing protein [Limisphaerales bacterium]